MALLRIGMFGGVIPRLDPRGLPENNAQEAINARLTSGALRSWWEGEEIARLSSSRYRSLFRYEVDGLQHLAAFQRTTLVTKPLLTNDAFGRVYLSDSTGFYITTKADLRDGKPPVRAGVPQPEFSFFRARAIGGAAAYTQSRVYVATLVSKYGEEGPPRAAELSVGSSEGKWVITGMDTLGFDRADYANVTHLRLHRTITSSTGVDYRMVEEWPIGAIPPEYTDALKDTELASRPVLESLLWEPPPAGLRGVIPIAGGFLAGFVGRTLYFSHPYYPHAWPAHYQLAVDDEIVALGTYGNVVVITTVGRPAMAVGMDPEGMALSKSDEAIPCLSAEGLVSTADAVIYPSTRGLVMVSDGAGFQTLTSSLLTGDEWRVRYAPSRIRAMLYEGRYIGLYSRQQGFVLDPSDPVAALTDLQQQGVRAVGQDDIDDWPLMLLADGRVVRFDGRYMHPMTYVWRSKQYLMPKPLNFGAFQLRADFDMLTKAAQSPLPSPAPDPAGIVLNEPDINESEIMGTPPPVRTGEEVLDAVLVRVFADEELVWEEMVRTEDTLRLPSGFKAAMYEVEVSGQIPLSSVTLASTAKELERAP